MTITLNHLVVPAEDKTAAATFLANLLGLRVSDQVGPFIPLRVNDDLTVDFDDRGPVRGGHYAFLVDDDTFDAMLRHLSRSPDIDFGAGVEYGWNRQINHLGGGRGVYVRDPNGHSYEFFTVAPDEY
jgi:catechol 2,3-dioxygenase-like lactoylglutathione lyase family enzyme